MNLVSIDTETELFDEKNNKYNYNVEINHISYCSPDGKAHFIAKTTPDKLCHLQKEIDTADTVTFHHAKFDLPKLAKIGVLIPQAKVTCSLIGFALLQGPRSNNGLKPLAKKLLGMNMDDFDESLYTSIEEMEIYAKKDAIATRELYPILLEKLDKQGLLSLYQDVELPLIPALIDLESHGIKIDLKGLKIHCRELLIRQKERLENLALRISSDFNPNSPTQIASYIHDTLGVKAIYHTKKGKRATDVKSLEKYNRHKQDETISEITAYLNDSKFLSNQAIPILKKCDPTDGRLRCTYNPLGTETGRFTANNPNLQGV
jgi:DNA polymerase I